MEKAYKGMGMEGSVARWYEKTTRKDYEELPAAGGALCGGASGGRGRARSGAGTGISLVEMAKTGRLRVTGLDISKTFVEIARRHADEVGVRVDFQNGNASQMPFADGSFDFLVCRAAFKNFSDPVGALREMRRVLRPGRKGVVIDLRRDVSMKEINKYVEGLDLPRMSALFTKLTFRFMLLKRAYTQQEFEAMLRQVSFANTRIDANAIGMEVWMEK